MTTIAITTTIIITTTIAIAIITTTIILNALDMSHYPFKLISCLKSVVYRVL